jgi:undecaprenyl-diphosphatase
MVSSWDWSAFHAVNSLAGHVHWIDRVAAWFAQWSPYVVVALLVVLWFSGRGETRLRNREGVLHAGAALVLGLIVTQLISMAYFRPRPFMAHHVRLLVAKSLDTSFPSNHATAAFAIATAVLLYNRAMGGVLLVVAALIGLSRVYVGLHYPGDVLVGALLGGGIALALLAVRPLLDRAARLVDGGWRKVGLP